MTEQTPAAETTPPAQWTMEKVKGASPQELRRAIEAGLLVALGFGPSRKRSR